MVKNLPSNAEDGDSIPGWGRSHMPLGNKAHVSQLLSPCTLASALATREKLIYCNKEPTAAKNKY